MTSYSTVSPTTKRRLPFSFSSPSSSAVSKYGCDSPTTVISVSSCSATDLLEQSFDSSYGSYSPSNKYHKADDYFYERSKQRSWVLTGRLLAAKRLLVIFGSLCWTGWTIFIYNHQVDNDNNVGKDPFSKFQVPYYPATLRERQLFQDLPTNLKYVNLGTLAAASTTASQHYAPKPHMMGMLWPRPRRAAGSISTKLDDKGEDIAEALVVIIHPYSFQVRLASRPFPKRKQFKRQRRHLKSTNEYTELFPPFLPGRSVTFDVDFTNFSDVRFEEKDEGMKWPVLEGCEMQYKWQTNSHPTCNTMHEQDVPTELGITFASSEATVKSAIHDSVRAQLLAAGGFRNVWMIHNGTQVPNQQSIDPPVALKTLLYKRDWHQVQFTSHNLDALVASELQSSKYLLNVYGYCGTSGIYEFAAGGNLMSVTENFQSQYTPRIKLELSYNVAHAIADLHNMAKEGQPVVAHTDIFPDQFVRVREDTSLTRTSFKLNDFNRGRWINLPKANAPSNVTKESCGFTFPRNRGKFRSPEEYMYQLETEKVDVYSMGNIFYFILTGEFPFEKHSRNTIKSALKAGKRQRIPEEYAKSEDPMIQAVVKAIRMSWIQNPTDRATARQVQHQLERALRKEGWMADE